jgi:hypothetical protein
MLVLILIGISGALGCSRQKTPPADAVEPNKIGATKVLVTLVGGNAVYQDPSWGGKQPAASN